MNRIDLDSFAKRQANAIGLLDYCISNLNFIYAIKYRSIR